MKRERDKHDERDRRDTKFEVLGSKFRKPRTSDLEPSAVPLVSHVGCKASQGYSTELVRRTVVWEDKLFYQFLL